MASPADYFCKPRKIDDEALERTIVNSYDTEQLRRRRTVDDEFREELEQYRKPGQFMYSDWSVHDVWQKDYLDKYGEFIPMDHGWMCPKCGTKYLLAYPPLECNVCHNMSPFGQLVKDGYMWRK